MKLFRFREIAIAVSPRKGPKKGLLRKIETGWYREAKALAPAIGAGAFFVHTVGRGVVVWKQTLET